MKENLMNADHKASNENYRNGYDRIQWNKKIKRDKGKGGRDDQVCSFEP